MRISGQANGLITIRPHDGGTFTAKDRSDEITILEDKILPAVRKLIADQYAGARIVFSVDSIDLCSLCGEVLEVLAPAEVEAGGQDVHSVPDEPVCCYPAIAEFRKARGIPALVEGGAA